MIHGRQASLQVSLDDRYVLERGTVYLSGIQALVRLPMDQNRRDRRAGLRIGTFISGYPGSPLGGLDLALTRAGALLGQHDVVHQPGANEELAATALMGTQMLDRHPHSRFDGVVGFWYGKGPGADRSGDALRHGNFAGTSRHGAVVVLSGEDHEAKSSTMPFQQDYAFMSAGIPVLYPASAAEFLELGLHAVALSRFSGCWVALKLVNALCDGGQTVEVDPARPAIVLPDLEIKGRPFTKVCDFGFFPGKTLETEAHLYYERHLAVREYARLNRLNRVEVSGPADRIGLVAAGKSYADLCQALADLGLDGPTLQRLGVRLIRMGLIYPVDGAALGEFTRGLNELIVVEEKRGFLEGLIKDALGSAAGLRVIGKRDEAGEPLFPVSGALDADLIAERLGRRLLPRLEAYPKAAARLAELEAIRSRRYQVYPGRAPNYCSGCPHNTSTLLLDGQIAWGSPGCHSFASIIEQPRRQIVAMTQYGGEGAPWVGLAPFTDRNHMVQNVGDGSLFHSSLLNIRFCVAAGVNITFKVLYNGAVANTGAQWPVGAQPVPELTRLLELEGARRIAVVTKNPRHYRGKALAAVATVYPRERLEEAEQELRATPGVTVLIYDELCANERRRRQKRGRLAPPGRFVMINEQVCEGCGDCGVKSNCMSLHRVETEFGPKTAIHQSSCNQDELCLTGDCPAFVTVQPLNGTGLKRPRTRALAADELSEPASKPALDRPYHIYSPGVGGTGVVTVNALLCQAALLDGRQVLNYDQTGAAQKWGSVLSSLVLAADRSQLAASRIGAGKADLYLAYDLLGAAAPANLDRCSPTRTAAVVNTTVLPSGEMVRNIEAGAPVAEMADALAQFVSAQASILVEAGRIAEALLGDYMTTNVFSLGVAYQAGLIPLSAASIEKAVRLNGAAVERNLQAFRLGRLWVAKPERIDAMLAEGEAGARSAYAAGANARNGGAPADNGHAESGHANRRSNQDAGNLPEKLRPRQLRAYQALTARASHLDQESRRLVANRVAELIDYQNARYAGAYLDYVLRVAERERRLAPGRCEITQAVARYLYKLMANKDEYEVARLYLRPEFEAQLKETFDGPATVTYHFHPPLLRALGVKHKVALGPWFKLALRMLRGMRRLRATVVDPFGMSRARREERRAVEWYKAQLDSALERLSPESYELVNELARLPDLIRGYEQIRLDAIGRARRRSAEILARLGDSPPAPAPPERSAGSATADAAGFSA